MTAEQKLAAIQKLLDETFDKGWVVAIEGLAGEDPLENADRMIALFATMCESMDTILDL